MGFSRDDMKAIASGRAVAKSLEAPSGTDMAVVGAVRIEAPMETFIARFRNITTFERADNIRNINKFSVPPSVDDLLTLALDRDDLTALRNCRPRNCDVQLGAEDMERFRTTVAWRAPAATAQANALMRQVIFEQLTAYRERGLAGLDPYADREAPRSVAAEFARLDPAKDAPVPIPAILSRLREYPGAPVNGAEEFFYWAKVSFGLKPTVRLNHVTFFPRPGATDGVAWVLATNQLYASHYFSTALELRFLIPDEIPAGATSSSPQSGASLAGNGGFTLVLLAKSRVPGLTGVVGSVIRLVVKSRSRGAMERHLAHSKKLAEQSEPPAGK